MRRIVVAGLAACTLALAAPAEAQVPRHLHCLTDASGETHAIAGGLTANAPQLARRDPGVGVGDLCNLKIFGHSRERSSRRDLSLDRFRLSPAAGRRRE